jgi:hypothetical protein
MTCALASARTHQTSFFDTQGFILCMNYNQQVCNISTHVLWKLARA